MVIARRFDSSFVFDRDLHYIIAESCVKNKKKDGGSGSAKVRAIRIIRGSDELQADVKLRGYSGWNTRMALKVLDQVFPKGAAVQPSLVIVNFGGDDATNPHPSGLGAHVPLLEYIENMRKIIMHLKTAIREKDDWANTYLLDGIHLLSEGSKVVVEEILKTLKNVMWDPSLYWLSIAPEFREDSPYYPVNLDGKTTCNVSGIINSWQRQWLSI
ncbi:hypothetical protein ACS0TY_013736 [Phlomoides rotata]